jgi:hypothetical protein
MTQQNLKWTLSLQVEGGPAVNQTGTLKVDDYDSIALSIQGGANQTVAIPGLANLVKFLLVTADNPKKVTFTPAGGTPQVLDPMLILTGAGAITLLGNPPGNVKFTNTDAANPVNVQILVGRNES